jgi:hypothetical protein
MVAILGTIVRTVMTVMTMKILMMTILTKETMTMAHPIIQMTEAQIMMMLMMIAQTETTAMTKQRIMEMMTILEMILETILGMTLETTLGMEVMMMVKINYNSMASTLIESVENQHFSYVWF